MLTIGDKLNSTNHQCTFRARSSVIAARAAKKAGLKDGMLQQLRRAHETCDSPVHAYSYGKSLLDCDRAASAAGFLAIAARSESPEPEWVYRHAVALERLREYEGAISELEYASNLDPARGEYHYRKGVCLTSLGRHAEAFDQYEIAIELNPRDNRATDRLLKSLDQKIPLWRRVAVLEKAVSTAVNSTRLTLEYARSEYWMEHYDKAVVAYNALENSLELGSRDLYKYGVSLYQIGADPEEIYVEAVRRSSSQLVKRIGVGALHETEKNYRLALKSYTNSWNESDGSAERAFRAGIVAEKLYQWEQALDWYRRSIELNPHHAYRQYKLALAAERTGLWEEAASHYTLAADLDPKKGRYWLYRAGQSLSAAGETDRAVDAMLESTGIGDVFQQRTKRAGATRQAGDSIATRGSGWASGRMRMANEQPSLMFKLGVRMMKQGEFSAAAWSFTEYLKRTEPRNAEETYSIASCYQQLGDLDSASNVLKFSRDFIDPDGLDVKKMTKNIHVRRAAQYADYRRSLQIDETVVLYESYWGTSVSCHPLALYRQLREDPRGQRLVHVWVTQASTEVPADVQTDTSTVIVKYGSPRYLRYLATAKYLINNTSFVPYFVRRDGQRYLNTWHGTPLKTLGRAVQASVTEHGNITRNLLQATHIIAPNSHTRDVLLRDFDIAGISTASVKIVGSPRMDRLVDAEHGSEALRRRLGLKEDDDRKVVLFAPTWRGTNNSRELDVESLRGDLAALDSLQEFVVLFRGHHLTESKLIGTDLESRVVPRDIDTYELLEVVDCLVTDYSSLLFDFLATGRRVVAYVPDEEEYANSRGLYFPPSSVVGTVARNQRELLALVSSSPVKETDELYGRSAKLYCEWEDGHAAERSIDFLFNDNERVVHSPQKEVLGFFASLLPNGITSALRDLINAIPESEARVVLFVETRVSSTDHIESFVKSLNRPVQVISRVGESAFTLYERQAYAEFKRTRGFGSVRHREIVQKAFTLELRRLVGTSSMTSLMQFEGYASYWTALFSRAHSLSAISSIYLHNEMEHEVKQKYPYLREIFSWLEDYDRVATVSEAVSLANRDFFRKEGYFSDSKEIVWLRNVLDVERVVALASEPSDVSSLQADPLIVAAGRLSIEKNHIILVEMMPEVLEHAPSAHLLILGEGPLRSTLEATIDSLHLRSSVTLVGHVSNPYPYISAADVFVLPSLHEGQPVVLYEALALGTRFVAASTPGTTEAAAQFDIAVVDPDPKAFASAVLDGSFGVPSSRSTIESLNEDAIGRFRAILSID